MITRAARPARTTKVVTGRGTRWSYVNVWQPRTVSDDGTQKFSISLIIAKSDQKTIDDCQAAIVAAYEAGENKLKGTAKVVPPLESVKTPLRDGDIDRPHDPVYADSYFINANSTTAPEIVDQHLQPIIDREEVYSGCYGRASITFYAYNFRGTRGIACGLNNLQKTGDGEPLGGGKPRAEEDFTAEAEDDIPF